MRWTEIMVELMLERGFSVLARGLTRASIAVGRLRGVDALSRVVAAWVPFPVGSGPSRALVRSSEPKPVPVAGDHPSGTGSMQVRAFCLGELTSRETS
jgi:hypothetical protein